MKLNHNQLSFLISLFAMGNILLLAFNIHMGSKQEEDYAIEMALIDEEEFEKLFEEQEDSKQKDQAVDPIKSHMAMNETAKPSYGEPEPLKTLEELLEEQAMDETNKPFLSNDARYAANLKELAEKRAQRKEQLGEREAEKKEFTNYLKDKRTSITYSLVERNHLLLPPPIYTCEQGGKVVINIKVDADGNVYEADLNTNSSDTSDYCLVENAIAYAFRSKFDSSQRNMQLGTITYLYQSK